MVNENFKTLLEELNRLFLGFSYKGLSIDKISSLEPKIKEIDFAKFIKYAIGSSSDTLWTDILILYHKRLIELNSNDLVKLFEPIETKFDKNMLLGIST
ncbi:MAG: hypothetical protein ACI8YQ_004979 [Polaribacter sp.]|jgi:hypothetical protein